MRGWGGPGGTCGFAGSRGEMRDAGRGGGFRRGDGCGANWRTCRPRPAPDSRRRDWPASSFPSITHPRTHSGSGGSGWFRDAPKCRLALAPTCRPRRSRISASSRPLGRGPLNGPVVWLRTLCVFILKGTLFSRVGPRGRDPSSSTSDASKCRVSALVFRNIYIVALTLKVNCGEMGW